MQQEGRPKGRPFGFRGTSWHHVVVALAPDTPSIGVASRAWYGASIREFLATPPDLIVGQLATNSSFDVRQTQAAAWQAQIAFLRSRVTGLDGSLFFEFSIPRMGRRIDSVLLIGPVVFVIEFKIGADTFDAAAIEQVWDYALDLKNFHEASHDRPIVPILVATDADPGPTINLRIDPDGVYRPLRVTPTTFCAAIDVVTSTASGPPIDAKQWVDAPYRPTPTIVEAARALYAQHSVEAIARHDAGAENLRVTSEHVGKIIDEAKRTKRKVICFVTGVPGAGKTLVGLNLATQTRGTDAVAPAVYLSGNGPLVDVLREALTRDEVERQRTLGNKVRKGRVAGSVKAFIQNVHHFRDDKIADQGPPAEHVAIFDEAQRAWNLHKTVSWMRRKKGVDFLRAEADFLIACVDRHADWGVVVCLVGGGQEINDGEAGIDAWLDAVKTSFPDWRMHISSRLTDSEYAAGHALDAVRHRPQTFFDDCLHLSVSMRSFRAENVSEFVKAMLDREQRAARESFDELSARYPVAVARDLDAAKEWVRDRARGSERYGLLASSKAMRLKPHAIDVRVDVDPVSWFLNGRDDTRSSWYLEDAATEFQVQGLELDWTVVTWDGDLRTNSDGWSYHDFRGSRWMNVKSVDNRRYLLNAYRVLLTRARQGMVIFVPPGNRSDPTRPPEIYDDIFRYLQDIGVPTIT
ncbi:MAG TPA: DUF2075 domain-containing protein [Thermoanaerobaculia bacterium]|nr:DUF2075 domain-containing protein [Thermoanaerobaculia bacterium]